MLNAAAQRQTSAQAARQRRRLSRRLAAGRRIVSNDDDDDNDANCDTKTSLWPPPPIMPTRWRFVSARLIFALIAVGGWQADDRHSDQKRANERTIDVANSPAPCRVIVASKLMT